MTDWQQKMARVHNKADLILAKQRHGPTGTIKLFFEAEFTRFADLEHARWTMPAKGRKAGRTQPGLRLPLWEGDGGRVARRDPGTARTTSPPNPLPKGRGGPIQPPPTGGGGVLAQPPPTSGGELFPHARLRAGAVLDIDLGAIVANWRLLCARASRRCRRRRWSRRTATAWARTGGRPRLHAAGCRHFFVALPDEALAIRPHVPDAMVAVLGGLMPGSEADYRRARHNPGAEFRWPSLTPGRATARDHRPNPCPRCCTSTPACPGSAWTRTNWPCCRRSRERLDGDRAALHHDPSGVVGSRRRPAERRPASTVSPRPAALLPPAPRSLANSSGIFLGERWGSDLARPGAALYGVNPTPGRPNPMRLPVRLRARVLSVRDRSRPARASATTPPGARRAPSRIATVGDRLCRWLAPQPVQCRDRVL